MNMMNNYITTENVIYIIIFHSQKTLEKMSKELETEQTEHSDERWRSSCVLPMTSSRVLARVCIFCEKEIKCVSHSKTRETLFQSRELWSDDSEKCCTSQIRSAHPCTHL